MKPGPDVFNYIIIQAYSRRENNPKEPWRWDRRLLNVPFPKRCDGGVTVLSQDNSAYRAVVFFEIFKI